MHRIGKEKNKTEGFTNYFTDTYMPSSQISNNSRKTVSQMYTHTSPAVHIRHLYIHARDSYWNCITAACLLGFSEDTYRTQGKKDLDHFPPIEPAVNVTTKCDQ